MMLPTHLVLGLTITSPLFVLFPEHTTLLIGSSLIGSTIPDFDLLVGQHRRTLHRTIYLFPVLPILIGLFLILQHPLILSGIALLISLFAHPPADFVGGGLSKTPWDTTDDQTVYDHYNNQWRYHSEAPVSVKYDGSPYDLGLLIVLSVYLSVFGTQSRVLLPALFVFFGIGVLYTVVRKYLPSAETLLYKHIPVLRPFINTLHGEDESEQK